MRGAFGCITFIYSLNIYNDQFEISGLVYLPETQANDLSNVEVLQDDVLLNITGDSVALTSRYYLYVHNAASLNICVLNAEKILGAF